MDRWHAEFEADNPHTHEMFLRSLGLSDDEVTAIRQRAGRARRASAD
jgi:hypothetical protein